MTAPNSIGVLLCTYRRPDNLAKCLEGLAAQTRIPNDIIVVARESDEDTQAYLQNRKPDMLPLRLVPVSEPGLVAARNAGLAACRTDILAMIDDDAVPRPQWVERILAIFQQHPKLGGLGGRDRSFNGISFDDRQRTLVGKLHWSGKRTGNHHIGAGPIREVDLLKGANMSYRAAAMENVRFETRLHGSGAQPYEDIAFCLAVRREGWQLMYDPAVLVDHYEGSREEPRYYSSTMPVSNAEAFRNFAYNGIVAFWDEFSTPRLYAHLLWSFFVGTRVCPGLVQAIRFTPSMGWGSWYRWRLAQEGVFSAFADLRRQRKPSSGLNDLASQEKA